MKMVKEVRENAAVLTLTGEFDAFVCPPFVEQVQGLFEEGVKHVLLDLRLVIFINSTAVGTLVKMHKEAEKQEGSLWLCRPSKFVAGVLETLGLTGLFRMSDDVASVLEELGDLGEGTDMGADSSVIIHTAGGREKVVGKIASLEEEAITVKIPERRKDMSQGTELKLKFRLPLFRKGHYFEADAVVEESVQSTTSTQLRCSFGDMSDENRRSISQFVEEMKYLRAEARKGS